MGGVKASFLQHDSRTAEMYHGIKIGGGREGVLAWVDSNSRESRISNFLAKQSIIGQESILFTGKESILFKLSMTHNLQYISGDRASTGKGSFTLFSSD